MPQITPDFHVAAQISVDEIADLARAGIRSVMCNRPDDEDPGQPGFASIEQAARAAGLDVAWVPVPSSGFGPQEVAAFRDALQDLPAPVLAYCRSGTRCTRLWTIVSFDRYTPEQLVELTGAAGYDMRALVGQLAAQRQAE